VSSEDSTRLGKTIHDFVGELYPMCRSITGAGVRQTLQWIGRHIPLEVSEVPSGTQVFDWQVPKEWNIRSAQVRDSSGRNVVDFSRHNLHVVSYSIPVRKTMSLAELRPHLHSLPEHPDWIPYRTSYYKETWGFCLADRDLRQLPDGQYEVIIDSTLEPGSLTYGEFLVRGEIASEVILYTHVCHPALANDNASGIALMTVLAQRWSGRKPRLSYRFIFGPGTIGSITWLARNEATVERIRHGLVIGLVGDAGPLTYKRSRRGDAAVDRAAHHVLARIRGAREIDFAPYGYDERQFCSPGFDLPVGRLTRSANAAYPEYHTSADDLQLVQPQSLAESLSACEQILEILDGDQRFINTAPKCEPQLGRRGLYRATGGTDLPERENALLWVLNQSDGDHSLLDVSERSGLPFATISQAAAELEQAGLLRRIEPV
jgi:aminopeptidase-like protein